MEEIAPQIDIEKLINERRDRHTRLMKDLDSVMEVLISFSEQAEWMMEHDYRIGELIGEVIVASTEVEHILPRTEQYFEEYQRMILPAIESDKPKNFDNAMRKIKGVLPRLKPYCDNIKKDENALNEFRNGEVELTIIFNNKYIYHYEIAIENLTAAVGKMERHIVESKKKYNTISDDTIKLQFDTMFRQYCVAKSDELKDYLEEIEDTKSAKNELIAAYQSSGLYTYYHQHKNSPEKIVRALKDDNKYEKSLLDIFDIKARMDVIQKYNRGEKKDVELQDNKEQPVNQVFIKFHDGKAIDFLTVKMAIELKLVKDIKNKYEWYAAYRILDDLKLLEDNKLSSFAKQMNIWFPDAKAECKQDSLGDYANGHTSKRFELWDEEIFKKEIKKNQSIPGFRKICNICNEIKYALNPIPTLTPRQQ